MGGRPNLFIVGAMRAGTTALHEALESHPDVYMAPYKEPAYFTDPAQLATDSAVVAAAGYAGNTANYESLFADAAAERYLGESSTHYTKQPRITGVADRLADYAPDARIIYIVRQPVERTISHYRFEVQRRYETRSPLEAFHNDPIYVAVRDYARQIQPFIERLGRDRVYLAVLEDLVENPASELQALYEWLTIDLAAGVLELPRSNALDGVTTKAPRATQSVRKSGWYRSLVRLIPKGVRRAAKSVVDQPFDDRALRSPAVRDFLTEQLEPTIPAFEELAGRSFPTWRRTDAPEV